MTETLVEFIPCVNFTEGTFKDVPLLYHDGYKYFRGSSMDFIFKDLGLFKYYLRHGDDGDWSIPVSIERDPIMVNYCGFILTKEDLTKKFPELVVQIDDDESNYHKLFLVVEDEDDAYDIISPGEDGEYADFLEFIGGHSNENR